MTSDPILQKWQEWLDELDTEVYELLWLRYVFTEIRQIVQSNPKIQTDMYFYEWLSVNFSATVAIAVRRQIDCDSSVITLGRLLFEIQQSPHTLTLQRFEELFTQGHPSVTEEDMMFLQQRINHARKTFAQFSGTIGTHLDPLVPCKDLAHLNDICHPIRKFVNKRVAHHDRKPFTQFPTLKELDEALDALIDTYRKYTLLIRGIPYDVTITPQWDWKEIFKTAWIQEPPLPQ